MGSRHKTRNISNPLLAFDIGSDKYGRGNVTSNPLANKRSGMANAGWDRVDFIERVMSVQMRIYGDEPIES